MGKKKQSVTNEENWECTQCGRCCFPVTIAVKLDPEISYEGIPDDFINKHWHLFGYSEKHWMYGCDYYNQETKLCKIHDHKPGVYRSYPNGKECHAEYSKGTD